MSKSKRPASSPPGTNGDHVDGARDPSALPPLRRGRHYVYPETCLQRTTYTAVTERNLFESMDALKTAINSATFIALDMEFSGLASDLNAPDLDTRYNGTREFARDYAILSMGVSCFRLVERGQSPAKLNKSGTGLAQPLSDEEAGKPKRTTWEAQTFNILLRPEDTYQVSTRSLHFLAMNGFDFQAQILYGIPYAPGTLPPPGRKKGPSAGTRAMRALFDHLRKAPAPIVVHNAWLDLAMLYHAFYADLPADVNSFKADLSHLFPRGLFDTKLVAAQKEDEHKTVLAHIFRKYERMHDTAMQRGLPYLALEFGPAHVDLPAPPRADPAKLPVCKMFKRNGYCKQNMQCGQLHDVDAILDEYFAQKGGEFRGEVDAGAAPPPAKRRRVETMEEHAAAIEILASSEEEDDDDLVVVSGPPTLLAPPPPPPPPSAATATQHRFLLDVSIPPPPASCASPTAGSEINTHAAHMDAVMTGFLFAHQIFQGWVVLDPAGPAAASASPFNAQASDDFCNKMYLMNMNYPWTIRKSPFDQYSPAVLQEIDRTKRIEEERVRREERKRAQSEEKERKQQDRAAGRGFPDDDGVAFGFPDDGGALDGEGGAAGRGGFPEENKSASGSASGSATPMSADSSGDAPLRKRFPGPPSHWT
ncbi:Target of EGR1, member 1 (Nuclear) [Allomyces javanicus]|nr:Target of EGR1, member 1 (Nuclear) [Allomyces javanicus]